MKMKLFGATILGLIATSAAAHHGSSGQFNHDIKIEATGVVTDVRFVNPHAWLYFNATGDNGEVQEWRCELRGGCLLYTSDAADE